ncbi:proline--tRNA ligase [Butyrivibrio sp. AE2032]|uniref:proline--tRNA ligase n=1 Tax=Butyrivibrio sp. AE2032 TaxID=1458463 RepID=UPI0005528206|nr:proline--tRNA ligase [Butyrivibrio sp. AE2032]
MRVSNLFMATQREIPADAEIPSHRLMLRAGLIRKMASGVYSFMPMGYRTYKKVEAVIREEMDKAGAQELIMPALLPAEAYQGSGRWEKFGPEMFRLTDRGGRSFCLGPTHEEPFTEAVRDSIRSYKQLPVTLYQIQHKYRDEKRPRFGVIRAREFVMKDAYSFDVDEAGLDISYKKMYDAYRAIFDRLGLDYTIVDADSGAMGGSGSQEFMVKSEVGEDAICFCDECGYAANEEKAGWTRGAAQEGEELAIEKIHTPDVKTIEELCGYLNCGPDAFVKTILYNIDGKFVAAMCRGDRDINETKLGNLYDATEMELAAFADVEMITGAKVGFAGPVGLKQKIDIVVDPEVTGMKNFVVGACETDYHFKNVNIGRDFEADQVADITNAKAGDICPKCGKGKLGMARGVEVGHIFKLGTKYSDALGCIYLDNNGKEHSMVMGCYGIGVSRVLAAIIEQYHDDDGIIWPSIVAPYKVIVVPTKANDEEIMGVAEKIYADLTAAGCEVLIDDRNERPGVKFKDADLLGIPLRITVGRRAGEGIVEVKRRDSSETAEITVDEAVKAAKEI